MTLKSARVAVDSPSMPSRTSMLADERGFTLVELLVAAVVLVIGMAGAFTLLAGADKTTVTNNARMGATNLSRELLEDARSVDYDSLTPAAIDGALKAKVGTPTAPTPWTVMRRGIQYTVTTNVCTYDDPKDNVATTPPANVCTPQAPVPAAAGTLPPEIQPDDFRRVTVTVAWNTGSGNQSMKLVSLVNNPSGGLGPRITTFSAPPDNVSQLDNGTTATFPTVTTNAASVRWNSDGTPNGSGDSTGGTTSWTTAWQLGTALAPKNPLTVPAWATTQYDPATTVLDGTYTVSAQAYDDRGIAGDTRIAVLPLNRSLPATVTGFEAGYSFNNGRLEFRWDQNPERDITGYKVFDSGPDSVINNGNDTLVCGVTDPKSTSCVGSNGGLPGGTTQYYVVAYDLTDITNTTSTPRSSPYAQVVTLSSTQPDKPTLLTVLPDLSTGAPKLTWTDSDIANVRYFRIYRDGALYDRTNTNSTTWTDPNPGSLAPHNYQITAVGPGLNESQLSNTIGWLN
jgi:prepilin-type N-terminal cleavage/methylation domain-containing protein